MALALHEYSSPDRSIQEKQNKTVYIAHTHTCEKSSPSLLLIMEGQSTQGSLNFSKGAEAYGECEMAFLVLRPSIICLRNA